MNDKSKPTDPLAEYRKWLVAAEQKSQEDFDKTVLSLSGGALGISFVFLKDVIGTNPILHPSLLFASWLRPPAERVLIWAESPLQLSEGYVGIVKLRDYQSFIRDENGELADRIFEANVRGFQQDTPVNKQIRDSLRSAAQPNFWLLNNGITVIASNVQNAGHKRLSFQDPQIVNGLQTSREIFSYFSEQQTEDDNRSILVRVIVTGDAVVSDAVIKATNSQNKMPAASLRATDPIHHQIEDFFKQYGFYYDRRKGHYKDQGKPASKIISVIGLLQAVVSIVLQRPNDARARPSDYINDDAKYDTVFSLDSIPLDIYLTCVRVMRRVDEFLRTKGLESGDRRNIRFYCAAYLICRLAETPNPTVEAIQKIDLTKADDEIMEDHWCSIWEKYKRLGGDDTVAKGVDLLKRIRSDLNRRFAKKGGKT